MDTKNTPDFKRKNALVTNLSISQNFLKDSNLVRELLKKCEINSQDTVYDIGAGTGIITEELRKICKKVVSIELDEKLAEFLNKRFDGIPNVHVLNQDFLKHNLQDSKTNSYKIFSNIPFNISSQIFNKLFFGKNPPKIAYLIVQEETARRFLGIGEGYLVSTLLRSLFDIKIVHKFKRMDFSPEPRVDTVLLKVAQLENPKINPLDTFEFYDFVVYVLVQQKPTLKLRCNKLFTVEQFKRICTELEIRQEILARELTNNLWQKLFYKFKSLVSTEKELLIQGAFNSYLQQQQLLPKITRSKIVHFL